VHLYKKFFRMLLYSADSNVKVRTGSPKGLGMEFVCTKSHTGSKFSKTSITHVIDCSCAFVHLYCGFSLRRQMAPQQGSNFRTAIFGQFCTSLRKDGVANYAWIWTLFSPSVRRLGVLYNALKVS